MRRVWMGWVAGLVAGAIAAGGQVPQTQPKGRPEQVPEMLQRHPETAPEPTAPPAQQVKDARGDLSFDLPAGWNLARRDGEVATFALDARTSLPRTRMEAVASLAFNPFPSSTFAGALFYVSATAPSTALACSNQAVSPPSHPVTSPVLDSVTFKHGYAEHGGMCIESRDEVYTALRGGRCTRFDLVINTFCSQASGSREMTGAELGAVNRRLETILETVRFSPQTPAPHGGRPAQSR